MLQINVNRDSRRCSRLLVWWRNAIISFVVLLVFSVGALGQVQTNYIEESNGNLTFPADENGYKIPDFSYAGYLYSEVDLPTFGVEYEAKVTLNNPSSNSAVNTTNIQNAINTVEALAPNQFGYRGAVVLGPGTWDITSLVVDASGVVIRGAGMNETILQNIDNLTPPVIRIGGSSATNNPSDIFDEGRTGPQWEITDAVVDVGDMSFSVAVGHALQVGDEIIVEHPCTDAWITAVDGGGVTNDAPWTTGLVPIRYWRTVTSVLGNTITVDVPIMYSLVRANSQCFVYKYTEPYFEKLGLENMTLDMDHNGVTTVDVVPFDGIYFKQAKDSWIRNVRTQNFRRSGFNFAECRNITLDSCEAIDPHSIIDATRRYNFGMRGAQNILHRDCYASKGRHNFVGNGWAMDSGNVYLRCVSDDNYAATEAGHQKWANGSLFDGCIFKWSGTPESGSTFNNQMFWLGNHGDNSAAHGWASVTAVAYKCTVASPGWAIIAKPPTGMNYEIDCVGDFRGDHFLHGSYPGSIDVPTSGILPPSLFEAQLLQRLGHRIGPKWLVSDYLIDFGYKVTNSETDIVVSFTNNSENLQSGSVSVDQVDYTIVSGASFNDLAVGANHDVTLRYEPTVAAKHVATLSFVSEDTVQIPILGIACDLQPLLNFDADAGTLIGTMSVGAGFVSTDTRDQGTAIYAINVGSAGTYQVDTSVNSPIAGSNSFFVAFDAQPTAISEIWDILPLTSGFETRSVSQRGLNGTFDNPEFSPATWVLSKGVHYLVIQGRETDTLLRDITLTPVNIFEDPGAVPEPPGHLIIQ